MQVFHTSAKFLIFVMIFSFSTTVVLADEPNLGILRVRRFDAPKVVAPNSVFSLNLDIEYGVHGRQQNDTFRAAIYRDNASDPIWQSELLIVQWTGTSSSSAPWGGDKIWNINLTSPMMEGSFKFTAYAFYFDDGAWRFYDNPLNGPGLREVNVRVGKTANLTVELGTPGVPVTIDNTTMKTSLNGVAGNTLFESETYSIYVPSHVEFQNSTRLIFNGWIDGDEQSQKNFVFVKGMKIIGSYRIQYLLQVNSIVSYSEWHDAGSKVKVQTSNSVPMNWPLGLFGCKYNFVDWTGDVNSNLNEIEITMNAPKTFKANFSVDYAPLVLVAFAAASSVAAFHLFRTRKNASIELKQLEKSNLHCSRCGESVGKDWTHCNRCGADMVVHRPVNSLESQD